MDTDPKGPVTVASANDEIEAGVLVSVLEAAGIEARMVGEFTSGLRAEAPGAVAILVRRENAERARSVLAEGRS